MRWHQELTNWIILVPVLSGHTVCSLLKVLSLSHFRQTKNKETVQCCILWAQNATIQQTQRHQWVTKAQMITSHSYDEHHRLRQLNQKPGPQSQSEVLYFVPEENPIVPIAQVKLEKQ